MKTRKKLKRIIELQQQLIEHLTPYYTKRPNAWIEEWYDSLTVKINDLK